MNLTSFLPKATVADFLNALKAMAKVLSIAHWEWILAIIYMESGINPALRNKNSGGKVTIPSDLTSKFGASVIAISKITTLTQLNYITGYFVALFRKLGITKISSFGDLYLVVFHPEAWGKADSFILKTGQSVKTFKANANANYNALQKVAAPKPANKPAAKTTVQPTAKTNVEAYTPSTPTESNYTPTPGTTPNEKPKSKTGLIISVLSLAAIGTVCYVKRNEIVDFFRGRGAENITEPTI